MRGLKSGVQGTACGTLVARWREGILGAGTGCLLCEWPAPESLCWKPCWGRLGQRGEGMAARALAGVHRRRGRSASPSRDAWRNGRMRGGPERQAVCASTPLLSYGHGCAQVGLIPRACFSGVCGERELPGSCCVKGNGV